MLVLRTFMQRSQLMVNDTTHVLNQSELSKHKPGNYRERMGYFMWMDVLLGPSTLKVFSGNFVSRQVILPGTSSRTKSFLTIWHRIANGQMCSFVSSSAERIKNTRGKDKCTRGKNRMARHPRDNNTLQSAGIIHEIYQGMRNLIME
ncbi:hypothetical protein Tco_0896116 [Tanacetum coccineum]